MISLCCLPTQYGKTFIATNYASKRIQEDSLYGKSMHIIVTMDNLLNNAQTALRFNSMLQDNPDMNGKVAIMSCKKMSKDFAHISSMKKLQALTVLPQILVVCNNHRQLPHIQQIVSQFTPDSDVKRIFLYFDELHKYIKLSRSCIETLLLNPIVTNIIGLTATPATIWSDDPDSPWYTLKMLPQPVKEMSPDYNGTKCMDFAIIDTEEVSQYESEFLEEIVSQLSTADQDDYIDCLRFIEYTLNKDSSDILAPNTMTFIPAASFCHTHRFVRKLVFHLCPQAVIVLINGTEKTLSYRNDELALVTVKLSDNREISDGVTQILVSNDIDRTRPIVFTGYICLGMGQTLVNKELGSFTSAIFGKTNMSNEDMYQLFGRVTGRMRSWPSYRKTTVYCSEIFKSTCTTMELLSTNLIENHNDGIVTRNNYFEPVNDPAFLDNMKSQADKKEKRKKKNMLDRDMEVFDTQEEAIEFAEEFLSPGKKFRRRKPDAHPPKWQLHRSGLIKTQEEHYKKMRGATDRNPIQMVITADNKWMLYWRPSLMKRM